MIDDDKPTLLDLEKLEARKIDEIEHSRVRRSILQGFERHVDTNEKDQVSMLDNLIRDKRAFKKHFSNIKYYSITKDSEAYQQKWLQKKCTSATKVLDFACGNGENGIVAASFGADVTGIDISPEGIENANLNAQQAGVSGHCSFQVMDGENMAFEDNVFDLGVEYGALHHVDLDRAMCELARVLKPNAQMICTEALRHNPLIHWYRRRTPHLRTQWEVEHILGVDDLRIVRKYFYGVEVKFFHLTALAAVPFRKTPFFHPLLDMLGNIDKILLKSTSIGKYAWIMIIVMQNPKKDVVATNR